MGTTLCVRWHFGMVFIPPNGDDDGCDTSISTRDSFMMVAMSTAPNASLNRHGMGDFVQSSGGNAQLCLTQTGQWSKGDFQ